MDTLTAMLTFLRQFPLWEQQSLTVDEKSPKPHTCQLFPLGLTVLRRRENVQGDKVFTLRQSFLLRRVAYAGQTAAAWLLALQNWLLTQPVEALEPAFGNRLRLWAEQGQPAGLNQPGTGVYQVKIHVEYEKE
ncbi:MAG: hypothetical protein IJB02_02815 [Oscillospiraceae bacterium]|nr:hypothetical protein [Oscillospiraceae bacterium]